MIFTTLENLKTSLEFYLLVLVSACFLYNVCLIYRPNPPYVHQFGDFDELSSNMIECPHEPETTSSRPLGSMQTRCLIANNSLQSYEHHQHVDDDVVISYRHIKAGGRFKPDGCMSRQKVAIVIPYRDRAEQLEKFTLYVHQFLPKQLIDYTAFVIEQADSKPFNRAKLFNAGTTEILKIRPDVCCFIFHDVDMLPLDQRNLYMCSYRPRHMSPSVSTLRFNLLYPELFGGVIAVTREQFESIGGFSNGFFGWGGEDDDIFERFRTAGYGVDRTPLDHGTYMMLKHHKSKPNPNRRQLIGSQVDQSNSANYSLESIETLPLYTRILVTL